MLVHLTGTVGTCHRYVSVDIACGEGLATLAALERGARMIAVDPGSAALQRLVARIPHEQYPRLNAHVGALPELEFVCQRFSAVHVGHVFHLLDPDALVVSLGKFFRRLYPGGKLFLSTLSPAGPRWKAFQGEHARRTREQAQWPGFIADAQAYFPDWNEANPSVHLIDEQVLRRELERVGFAVDEFNCYAPIWDSKQVYCSVVAHCGA